MVWPWCLKPIVAQQGMGAIGETHLEGWGLAYSSEDVQGQADGSMEPYLEG